MAEEDEDGGAPRRGRRVREVSAEEMDGFRDDLRYLIDRTDWSVADLNIALGLPRKSGALRNILYDKNNRVGTTRARYEALRRIRAEDMSPGVTLLDPPAEPEPPKRRGRGAAAAGAAANGTGSRGTGRGGRRRTAAALTLDAEETTTNGGDALAAAIGDSPAVVLHMGDTRFTARQQSDGSWQVTLSATCTTEQVAAWTRRVLNESINAVGAAATTAATAAPDAAAAGEEVAAVA